MPFVQVPGARLYYEVHGEHGPWLVFAHGAAGNTLAWWQQVAVFAPRHRCLLFDARGFGRSTCEAPADPTALADDLLAVMDHAGADRAAVVGQSMGGWAALGAALQAPERVSHLLLASTLAGLADDSILAALAARHEPGRPADPLAALAAEFVEREPVHTWLFSQVAALNPPISGPFLVALVGLRYEPPATPLPCPVRFVAGGRDRLFPREVLERAQSRLPGATLTVVPDAGHSTYWERPATFNAQLAALLGDQPSRTYL